MAQQEMTITLPPIATRELRRTPGPAHGAAAATALRVAASYRAEYGRVVGNEEETLQGEARGRPRIRRPRQGADRGRLQAGAVGLIAGGMVTYGYRYWSKW